MTCHDVQMVAHLRHLSTHKYSDVVRVGPKDAVHSCLEADTIRTQPSLLKKLALCTALPGLTKLQVSTRQSKRATSVGAKPANSIPSYIIQCNSTFTSTNAQHDVSHERDGHAVGQTFCPPKLCHRERSRHPPLREGALTSQYYLVVFSSTGQTAAFAGPSLMQSLLLSRGKQPISTCEMVVRHAIDHAHGLSILCSHYMSAFAFAEFDLWLSCINISSPSYNI